MLGLDEVVDKGAELAERFPKYWKPLPANWKAIDTYRVNELFPITGDDSGRLLHARKKLLVPGTRTGGKTLFTDIAEAHATLGAWLADNTPVTDIQINVTFDYEPTGCSACHGSGITANRHPCRCIRGK